MSVVSIPSLGPLANATPNTSKLEWFYITSTVTQGDWVIPDNASPFSSTGAYGPCGVKTSAATANKMPVGVVYMEGGVAGTTTYVGTTTAPIPVRVVTWGYCPSAKVNAGVADGDGLSLEAVAGSATTATAATFPYCGRALAAASGGYAAVWVK
jgi:hypothetical protein